MESTEGDWDLELDSRTSGGHLASNDGAGDGDTVLGLRWDAITAMEGCIKSLQIVWFEPHCRHLYWSNRFLGLGSKLDCLPPDLSFFTLEFRDLDLLLEYIIRIEHVIPGIYSIPQVAHVFDVE